VEDLHHLGELECETPEGVDVLTRVGADPHGDDRLETAAERAPIDVGVEPQQDAAQPQRPDPLEARRGGDPDLRCEVLVREPRILLQRVHDRAIGAVQALFCHRFRIIRGSESQQSNIHAR
jgi:hypothetical protein